jgi:hypothetical protein
VKGTGLLRPIETVPVPASVERKAGTTAVAVVFETVVLVASHHPGELIRRA